MSWCLVLLVTLTGWFLRDVLTDLRAGQREADARLADVSKQLSSFQVDIAVLRANYEALRDIKETVGRLETRILDVERGRTK